MINPTRSAISEASYANTTSKQLRIPQSSVATRTQEKFFATELLNLLSADKSVLKVYELKLYLTETNVVEDYTFENYRKLLLLYYIQLNNNHR